MDVMLIKTTFNDEVHGTSNGKRTGCGVNLLKAGNDTKFLQTGRMTDLKEITCEKCKEKIAKEIIKSDKKEMSQLLKEERAREKAGLADEGIVPLGNTTARITGQQNSKPEPPPVRNTAPAPAPEPAPAPAPAAPRQTIPGTGVAMDDSLAQFAINKPVEEEPAKQESNDDFLAQFAVNKPAEEEPAKQNGGDDFLAQFAINKPSEQPQQNDDIMNMFSVNNSQQNSVEQMSADTDTTPVSGMYDNDSSVIDVAEENINPVNTQDQPNAWDAFANQFFGMGDASAQQEPVQETVSPMGMEDMPSVSESTVPQQTAPQPAAAPVLDDISIPAQQPVRGLDDIKAPVLDDIAPKAESSVSAPVLDDISVPALDDIEIPKAQPQPAPVQNAAPVQPTPQPAPVQNAAPVQPAPQPTPVQNAAPVQPAPQPTPVQNAAPVQPAPQPTPVQNVAPVQPAPQPTPVQNVAPVQPMPVPGQIVTVPQITGYDQNGQPMYAYMQMQITGYDQNGQPMYAPIAGVPMGAPMVAPSFPQYGAVMSAAAASAGNVNTSKYGKYGLTPGQKIAAEAAARGNQIDANISKIAVNPHSKGTSQSFINAISEAKDKANQSLTDTQGLVASTPVIGSVEDMLAQLGDTSEKEKLLQKQADAQNVPVFSEYKGGPAPRRTSAPRTTASSAPSGGVYMSEKDRKKQAKIDAKFQKQMAKNKY